MTTELDLSLWNAANDGKLGAVHSSLAKGANPNAGCGVDGATALMKAAMAGHAACVSALLEVADTNVRDNDGWTALMYAARGRSLPVLEELASKSDVLARDKMGRTALMQAAKFCNIPAALALSAKPGFLARDKFGLTAIDIAKEVNKGDSFKVVRALGEIVPSAEEITRASNDPLDKAAKGYGEPAPAKRRGL
jgi:ankyrin repeat protein